MSIKSFNPIPIDPLLYPMMSDPYDRYIGNGYYFFKHEEMKGYVQENPRPVHPDGYLRFLYTLIIFNSKKEHVLSAVIEQTDYRLLSQITHISKKELMEGKKGYLSTPSLALYHSGGHEVLESVSDKISKEDAIEALIDIVCDALDTPHSPLFVDMSDKSH
ncbi:MAG: hypothetical protein EOM67_01065 [Spirochaetia bacterium]|nr:hypothetical protein [Spirochaetia bacterium]